MQGVTFCCLTVARSGPLVRGSTQAWHDRILVARVAVALVVGVMLGAVLDWLSTVSVGIGWLATFLIVGGMFVWLRQLRRLNIHAPESDAPDRPTNWWRRRRRRDTAPRPTRGTTGRC